MIVGATGSGKSTLINGMANFVMGVTWEDPFRFTLIHLENCELDRVGNEVGHISKCVVHIFYLQIVAWLLKCRI